MPISSISQFSIFQFLNFQFLNFLSLVIFADPKEGSETLCQLQNNLLIRHRRSPYDISQIHMNVTAL